MLKQQNKIALQRIWQWVSSTELLTYLSFVLLATLLWVGHALTSVRNARIPVHITYTGIAQNIAFSTPLPETIQIEVRDAGRRLLDYHTDPPKLTYDIASQLKSEKGEVHISEDVLRRNIADMLQGTSKLQQVSPEELHGVYYRQQERVVPIVDHNEYTADREYIFTEGPMLMRKKVTIYGAREVIHEISEIETEAIRMNSLQDTTDFQLALVAPEGIRLSFDSVTVHSVAERFTEKVLTLRVYPIAVPEDMSIRLFPQEVKVTARVNMAHFNEITEHDIKARCHFPYGNESQLPVNLIYNNPYIYGARVTPTALEFLIEQKK